MPEFARQGKALRTGRHGPARGSNLARRCRNMAADARVKITLRCNECKQRNYNTMKNKKNTSEKVELKKYCRFCRKHTVHTETK
jgi:large subunit ribosomal protein L33